MSNDKLGNIYKLLTEHNFDLIENVSEEFKCVKCKKILIEACQTPCGCRFCRSCVDEIVNNGCDFCPGNTNDCKHVLLSTVVTDYRANKQISKLIVKCPEEMCSYECELLEMSEHLRICGKKSLNCPFYKFGCNMRITSEKLIEHLQSENYNHNKILIDIIDNIKVEIKELREKELKNCEEIKQLKKILQFRDENLELINSEMEMLKKEKCEMENRMEMFKEILNNEIAQSKLKFDETMRSIKAGNEDNQDEISIGLRNVWHKIDKIDLELKNKCRNDKFESIKSEFIKKIEVLQTNFDAVESINQNDIKSINDEIRRRIEECKETLEKSVMRMRIEPRINQLENYVENKTNGIFELLIDNNGDDELRNHAPIWSEYFHARTKPYKCRMHIWRPSVNELWINLHICDDLINQILSFPFIADVTIKIINRNKRQMCKSITKYCQIEKPKINSFNRSDDFIYSCSELTKTGILEDSNCCFIVQCSVELK